MTITEIQSRGYRLIQASPFEVGLIHGERGVRTWWSGTFGQRMPTLDDPQVLEAIRINEQHAEEVCPECGRFTGNCYVCSECLKVSLL